MLGGPFQEGSVDTCVLNFPVYPIFFSLVACAGSQESKHLEESQGFSSCYFYPVHVRVSFGNDSVPTMSKNKDYPEE